MKKLMIAAALVASATIANAATVKWMSGVTFGPSDAQGTISQTAAYKLTSNNNLIMYVFATAGDELDNFKAGDGYKWVSGGATAPVTPQSFTGTDSSAKVNGSIGISTGTYVANDIVKAIIVFTYKDTNSKDWYLENTASVTIDNLGSDGSADNLARYIGGDKSSGNLSTWTAAQAVPEPTSAMLLLLGVAGLALRRRRA